MPLPLTRLERAVAPIENDQLREKIIRLALFLQDRVVSTAKEARATGEIRETLERKGTRSDLLATLLVRELKEIDKCLDKKQSLEP